MIDLDNIDWSRLPITPFEHQKTGVRALLKNRVFAIFDEQGAAKTAQLIWSACYAYSEGWIDSVLIMCPAQVKDVWVHPVYSQIIEHSFVKGIIHEFTTTSIAFPNSGKGLTWIVSSVELLRQKRHIDKLKGLLKGRRYWATVDESSVIGNWEASQTRGCSEIAMRAYKKTILNGTPYGNTPLTLYSQFAFLDKAILGFKNFYTFRNHHSSKGGFKGKQRVKFENLDEIRTKCAPYVLRRLKRECMDLPDKLNAPLREVKMKESTWEKYCQMRDEFVAYLEEYESVSVVMAATTRSIRLAQICSGFLGGFKDENEENVTAEVGDELTANFMDYYEFRMEQDPNFKLILWARFRPEIARLRERMRARFPKARVEVLQGGVSPSEREAAKTIYHPNSPDFDGPSLLICQPQAGRFGLNFAKCSNSDHLSNDFSHLNRVQSEDRFDRPGQKNTMTVQDYVVVGPNRERTISGIILKALRTHEDMAKWICSKWVKEVMQEYNDVPAK